MVSKIRFGTDGWRAIIARDFTFDNVALCAQGVAAYLRREGIADQGLVVGYDTRFASKEFADRVAEVLAGNGIPVYLSSAAVPTPVVSYNILHHGAAGAAIITASHNPAAWNGFKYKPSYAGSASPEVVVSLEAEIDAAEEGGVSSMDLDQARSEGLVKDLDLAPPYLEQMARLVDLDGIAQAGLKVVVDAMYGAGGGYLPAILAKSAARSGATQSTEIHGEPNPAFPGIKQPEPIASNLSQLSRAVVDRTASIGIALDGDADRVGIVDESGVCFSPLQTFALLAMYLLDQKKERGALVKSLTSTSMIDKLGEKFSVPVFETPVGFKYIGPVMIRENALIGGEESGGYGFRGHIPERDGMLSGLLVLEYMAKTGNSPSRLMELLFQMVGEHHYERRDVDFAPDSGKYLQDKLDSGELTEVGGMPVLSTDSVDGHKFNFSNGAWLLVRFSGTEPLLRIYAEAESREMVRGLLDGAGRYLGV